MKARRQARAWSRAATSGAKAPKGDRWACRWTNGPLTRHRQQALAATPQRNGRCGGKQPGRNTNHNKSVRTDAATGKRRAIGGTKGPSGAE